MKEIKIELTPEQRFWIESKEDGGLLLVKSILIHPLSDQMYLEGKAFQVDYEEMSIEAGEEANMYLEYKECSFWRASQE